MTPALLSLALLAAPADRPNVLFVMADDLRADLGCYGSVAKTPHLDALSKRGVRSDRAYCQQAVCNPSRSSLLTGRRPDTLQLWNNGTHFRDRNPDVATLPGWFEQHGYETRCVGKIFHNWHTKEKGDRRSWSADEFLHYANHGDDTPRMDPLPANVASPFRSYGSVPLCERRDVPDEAYYDGRVAAEAVRVLNEVKGKPFFLAVGFWKPHAPFNAPAKYWDLYERDKLPPFDPHRPTAVPTIALHDSREVLGAPPKTFTPTPAQAAEMRHGYFANISYMDAQVGKVLTALDASGAGGRTIVVFVSDHGYHIGEHTLWGKTSCFELDARVPLLIARPGAAGSTVAGLTELIDLFPTLAELAGLPKPDGLEGESLADPVKRTKAAAFTQHPRPGYYDRDPGGMAAMGYSVRTDRVRYTEWRDAKTGAVTATELYDHAADPHETRNRIADPPDPAALAEAKAALAKQSPPRGLR